MTKPQLDPVDRRILNSLQHGIPICAKPFAQAAEKLAISEAELISRLESLLERKLLSRFGPLYDAERLGGAVTLVALGVPPARFDEVAALVNAFPEVAHNYERDHPLNMWFVVATDCPERIEQVLTEIEAATGLHPINLPKEEEYFLELKLSA